MQPEEHAEALAFHVPVPVPVLLLVLLLVPVPVPVPAFLFANLVTSRAQGPTHRVGPRREVRGHPVELQLPASSCTGTCTASLCTRSFNPKMQKYGNRNRNRNRDRGRDRNRDRMIRPGRFEYQPPPPTASMRALLRPSGGVSERSRSGVQQARQAHSLGAAKRSAIHHGHGCIGQGRDT